MSDHPDQAPVLLGQRRTIRVMQVRRGRFVEFEFTVDHEDLTVELVMPWPELAEFGARNEVAWLAPADGAWAEVQRLALEHGDHRIIEDMKRDSSRPTNPTAGGQS